MSIIKGRLFNLKEAIFFSFTLIKLEDLFKFGNKYVRVFFSAVMYVFIFSLANVVYGNLPRTLDSEMYAKQSNCAASAAEGFLTK